MTGKEFYTKVGMSHQAYYEKLDRYSYELKGHIDKNGQLDEYAMELLMPQRINAEKFKKLFIEKEQLENRVTILKSELDDERRKSAEAIAAYEEMKQLQNKALSQLNDMTLLADECQKSAEAYKQLADEKDKRITELQLLIDEQNKNWDRLLNEISSISSSVTNVGTQVDGLKDEIVKSSQKKGLWKR